MLVLLQASAAVQHTYEIYSGSNFDISSFVNVERVDTNIRELRRGRAAGPDGLCAEHLQFSHPILCVLLSFLVRLMLFYSYVPDAFGVGMIIPLLKGDNCDSTVADNYRAITISPCISKVFEMCLHDGFCQWLDTDELQFGFKKGKGCRDAIFTLRGIVNNIHNNGSTAVICALDVSKAFDKMNHCASYLKLMARDIPKCFLDVIINWYSKCFAYVRWGSFVSNQFQIWSGVRQGGVLSPCLFAVFIDSIISKLRAAGHGAYIGKFDFDCLLYADDILMVSHSITAMQTMLNICSLEAEHLDFTFNTAKSVALRTGPRYRHACAQLSLSGTKITYVDQFKYLGLC